MKLSFPRQAALGTVLSLILCTAVVAAPKNPAGTTDIEVHERARGEAYMSLFDDALEKRAELMGYRIRFFDSGQDYEVQKQQMEVHVQPGLALIVSSIDPKRSQELVDLCRTHHNIIVFVENEPPAGVVESYDQAWYVGGQVDDGARKHAQMLLDYLKAHNDYDRNHNGTLDIMLLRGPHGNSDADARSAAIEQALKKAGIAYNIADEFIGEYAYDVARNHVSEVIAAGQFPNFDIIVANSDDMALGALSALELSSEFAHGKLNYLPILGFDGTPEAEIAIKREIMIGSMLNDFHAVSRAALNICIGNISKQELESRSHGELKGRRLYVSYEPVTKENLPEIMARIRADVTSRSKR